MESNDSNFGTILCVFAFSQKKKQLPPPSMSAVDLEKSKKKQKLENWFWGSCDAFWGCSASPHPSNLLEARSENTEKPFETVTNNKKKKTKGRGEEYPDTLIQKARR